MFQHVGAQQVSAFKETARRLVEQLPPDATWDDLYAAAYARAAAAGVAVLDPLPFEPDTDVDRLFATWRVDAVDRLPDDATWDDLIELTERARATVEGFVAIDRGEIATPEEVERTFARWRIRADG